MELLTCRQSFMTTALLTWTKVFSKWSLRRKQDVPPSTFCQCAAWSKYSVDICWVSNRSNCVENTVSWDVFVVSSSNSLIPDVKYSDLRTRGIYKYITFTLSLLKQLLSWGWGRLIFPENWAESCLTVSYFGLNSEYCTYRVSYLFWAAFNLYFVGLFSLTNCKATNLKILSALKIFKKQ